MPLSILNLVSLLYKAESCKTKDGTLIPSSRENVDKMLGLGILRGIWR